jgi:hypothetical protein
MKVRGIVATKCHPWRKCPTRNRGCRTDVVRGGSAVSTGGDSLDDAELAVDEEGEVECFDKYLEDVEYVVFRSATRAG